MGVHPLGDGDPGRHQHRRPIEAMEAGDVLADHVQIGRPPALEHGLVGPVADAGDVVHQRVAPDVDDVFVVAGKGDTPFDRRAGDAEVLQAGFEPAEHLVAARLWLDEVRMLVDVLLQPILVARQLEEVVLFRQPLRFQRGVDQAVPVLEVRLSLEGLAGDAVPTLVRALVDVAPGLHLGDEGLHPTHVVGILRPDEAVVADAETGLDIAVELGHPRCELSGGDALLLGPPPDVLRMLVRPGQKKRLIADQPVIACQRIRPDQLVDEAQVGRGVWIDDRSGDVELTHLGLSSRCRLPRPSARLGVEFSRSAPGVSPVFHVRTLRGPW